MPSHLRPKKQTHAQQNSAELVALKAGGQENPIHNTTFITLYIYIDMVLSQICTVLHSSY